MFHDEEHLMQELMKIVEHENNGVFKYLPRKVEVFKSVLEKIDSNVEGDNVLITGSVNEPFNGMGCISVTGKNVSFRDASLFAECASLASNINVYSKTNGSVVVDFTFHGLAKKVR